MARRPAAGPQQVFLAHGEETVALNFATLLREKLRCNVSVPSYQESVEL